MTSASEIQRNNIKEVLEEAKLFTTDEKQLQHLETFLEDYWGGTRVRPFKCQFISGKVGVRWDFEHGYLSVLFGSDDNWEWKSESTSFSINAPEGYSQSFSYFGPASYVVGGRLYYSLPTDVENVIVLPDEFVKSYDLIIQDYEYSIIWVTDKYDGMLTGYCRYKGKLHYYDMTEETEFGRKRMFVVYELSLWERIKTWVSYFTWYTILGNRALWDIYTKFHKMKYKLRMKTKPRYELVAEKRKQFEATHKVVGYFER